MIFRALTKQGDWTFGKGDSNYLKEDAAIKENIKTRYREWLGDCFFNQDAGIDWQTRLSQFGQENLLANDIKTLILKSEGVIELVNFDFSVDSKNRKFTANYTIKTIFSTLIQDNLVNDQ